MGISGLLGGRNRPPEKKSVGDPRLQDDICGLRHEAILAYFAALSRGFFSSLIYPTGRWDS
jgi:hypothetical protein